MFHLTASNRHNAKQPPAALNKPPFGSRIVITPELLKVILACKSNTAAAVIAVAIACVSAAAGMVRVWRLGKQSQTMEASMKDHKGPVNCIVVKASTDDECVSASSDGSCIIWDLNAGRRRQVRMAVSVLALREHPCCCEKTFFSQI